MLSKLIVDRPLGMSLSELTLLFLVLPYSSLGLKLSSQLLEPLECQKERKVQIIMPGSSSS